MVIPLGYVESSGSKRFIGEACYGNSQIEDSWGVQGSRAHVQLKIRGFTGDPCQDTLSSPEIDSFISYLRSCTRNKDLVRGTNIHFDLVQRGLLEKCLDAVATMYAKCGDLQKAQALLDMHESKDVITWTAMVSGYASAGQGQKALDCLEQMQHEGIQPNSVTYLCALKACATISSLDRGKQIHDEIARQGLLQTNIMLGNALVDMYAKCKDASEGHRVLAKLPFRDVVTWNTLITGYAQEGEAQLALNCLQDMQCEGILPSAVTYASALKACAAIRAIEKGKQIHDEIGRQGLLESDIVLGGALVDMYAKCRALSEARRVLKELPFRNVVCWNALIAGYAQEGEAEEALNCLKQLQHEGFLPNEVTYVCALKACSTVRAADKGKIVHDEIAKLGLLQNNSIVLGNALVDMYAKCGAFLEARQVLQGLPSSDVVSWNALIAGYTNEGEAQEALNCLGQMQGEGILPNEVTYAGALKACTTIRDIDRGKEIHIEILRQGLLQNHVVLGGMLVDMYAKCGDVSEARRVLLELPSRDVVSWNALISGYAQEGGAEQALKCFQQMQREGILPNAATCACVLNVCCHHGLIEEGQALLANMSTKYGVEPSVECYTCMIDLFGRAGHLEKAVRLIQQMPSYKYTAIWHALLGACHRGADANVGKWAFKQAVKLDGADEKAYILIGNIYAAAGMKEKAKSIKVMKMTNKA